ncbi:MAG: NAD(P)/FAD-dependent oxidoreductase [Candidatus Latescibacterota bacterium]|nr:NAD(P)/FAD-dependent oxidoreductase [Candidatus Latescibacterota bacterium]
MAEDDLFDAVVLGAGHNSLILAAYLGRAGKRVAVVERNEVAGGGLCTEPLPSGSGFLHNTHSFYHRAITTMPWYEELGLQNRGARYLEPELNVAMVLDDGDVLGWWTDFEGTEASFGRRNADDARALRRWRDEFAPIVEEFLVPEATAPPLAPSERKRRLQSTRQGRRLLEVSRRSPLDFVRQEFSDPAVQAGLLFFNGLREVDLREPGFGHHIPALLAASGKAQMCLGGSQRLAEALVQIVEESGGRIFTGEPLAKICIDATSTSARAIGVETRSGRCLQARDCVASGLNPQQTFLELIDSGQLPSRWRERAEAFRYNAIAPLFGIYLNLKASPRYWAATKTPALDDAFMVILGLNHIDDFDAMVTAHEAGRIPKPSILWGSCPTRFDPSQAPSDMHTAFMWQKVPYHLHGDANKWEGEAERHGDCMLAAWQQRAPELADSILDRTVRAPVATPRRLPNMRDADLLVGAFSHGQVGYHRPFAGAGQYRTAIDGLYLCGSSSHPGGNITGLPGYNAWQVIAEDLERQIASA